MAEPYQHVVFIIAIVIAAVGAVVDWRKGEIPAWLTTPLFLLAPAIHIVRFKVAKESTETALAEAAYCVGGAAICAIIPLIMYRKNAIGGGDVRIFIALGALLQPMLGVEAQMYGFFGGAILAPAKLAYEGKLLSTLKNSILLAANLFLPQSKQRSVDAASFTWFRLGPAIFLAVAFTAYLHW